MNSYPYMPLYWNDMIADNKVRAMSNGELGAYIRLLAAAWHESAPGTLPGDEETLARLAGVGGRAWRRLRLRVLACFSWNEDASRHEQKRMMHEYAALAERNDRRSDPGAKAAAARWNKAPSEGHTSHNSHASHSADGTDGRNAKNGNYEAAARMLAQADGMPTHANRNASALRPECLSESNSDSPSYIDSPRNAGMPNDECRMTKGADDREAGDSIHHTSPSTPASPSGEDAPDRHSSFGFLLRQAQDLEPVETGHSPEAGAAGASPDFARMIFADWSAREGRDGAGVLVPWDKYLAKRWAREGEEWSAGTHRLQTSKRSCVTHSGAGKFAGFQRPAFQSEYDRDRERTGIESTAGEALRRL